MKDYILTQLKNLTAIPSPTGFTAQVANYVYDELSALGYTPQYSHKGNVHVTLGGNGNPLVLTSHLDTLGAMVRCIKENGRLRPTTIGGHHWETADGENCTIHTRDGHIYTGVSLNTEPSSHVTKAPIEKTEYNMEILLDENICSKKEAMDLGIQNGDIIAMDPRTVITKSGYIKSRFLDDKLSVAILLGLAKSVKDEGLALPRKVTLIFSTYEEVGHGTSYVPADTEDILSVDMGCVGSDLECTEQMVSICAKDSGGPYNYDLVSKLILLAKKNSLNYAVDIYPYYNSDAGKTMRAGYDARHALIGPGVYASHNYERSHVEGMMNTYHLAKAFLMDSES